MNTDRQKTALNRAEILKSRIADYLEIRKNIKKGRETKAAIEARQKTIIKTFGASREAWNDSKWQLENRINEIDALKKFLPLSKKEEAAIKEIAADSRWSISPYYLSLIDPNEPLDPVRLMAVPTILELVSDDGSPDPMGEESTSPVPGITRRYPDRLIINVTNECPTCCRYCQRRRNFGQHVQARSDDELRGCFDYIHQNEEIRDVLITGGDPLTLGDQKLKWILENLRDIQHVEIIRIGTRSPVTLPQRINEDLVAMLKQYHPLYINTHFNHPVEITEEARAACEKLADAGIPLGNQTVHLNGVNNDKFVMRCLNQELLRIRVKPYYIFHMKNIKGALHFRTSIDEGIEIMEHLRGYTSGMAVPDYIINAPGGKGKVPILPEYLVSRGRDYFVIRTWEGEIINYENPPGQNIRKLLSEAENL